MAVKNPGEPFTRIDVNEAKEKIDSGAVQLIDVRTPGEYARGRHVIDPHSGRPPEGVLSVTITGPELATADSPCD